MLLLLVLGMLEVLVVLEELVVLVGGTLERVKSQNYYRIQKKFWCKKDQDKVKNPPRP